jgi:hypothetical protein
MRFNKRKIVVAFRAEQDMHDHFLELCGQQGIQPARALREAFDDKIMKMQRDAHQ